MIFPYEPDCNDHQIYLKLQTNPPGLQPSAERIQNPTIRRWNP